MNKMRQILVWILACSLIFSSFTVTSFGAAAKGKITVAKTKITLEMNKSYQLKPKASNKVISKKGYKYTSSNARVATVSSKGKIIAKTKGKTTITIKSKAKSTVSKKIKVTVVKRKNNVIAMEGGTAAKMNLGTTKVKNDQAKWISSNKKIATVTKNGIVKTISYGTTTITAKSKKLAGGKKVFKIQSGKKVITEKALREEVQRGTKMILIAKDIKVTSSLTIHKGTNLILAKGVTLKTGKDVSLKNLGRITNVVDKVYAKKTGKTVKSLSDETADNGNSEPTVPPTADVPEVPEPPKDSETPEEPEVPDNPGTPEEPEVPDNPGDVMEPELPTDEAIDQTEELNPKEEEGVIEAEDKESIKTEEASVIEVVDYANLVQEDALILREGCTVIVGGQKVIGPAGSDAWMTLSDPVDDSGVAAIWSMNGDGNLLLTVWGTLTVQRNEENLLTGIDLHARKVKDYDPVIILPSFNVLPYWGMVSICDSTLFVGGIKVVSKSDPDSVFNAYNEGEEEENRLLFRRMDNGTTTYTSGYVEINSYYPGLELDVSGVVNFFQGKQPYVKFNCDVNQWIDGQMKHHISGTSGAYPLDVADICGLAYHFELADASEIEKIKDAAPGAEINFMPYLGPYRMIQFIEAVEDSGRSISMKKVMGDRDGFIMRYQFTMPSSGVFIRTYTKHFNIYSKGEIVTGNPKSYYYFNSLEEAKQQFVDLTIEVDGVQYPITVEWKKMNAYDGQIDYSGLIHCPDLEGQYEFLGYIPAYILEN